MTAPNTQSTVPSTWADLRLSTAGPLYAYLTTQEGLTFQVEVLETRCGYGREDLLVAPVGGQGTAWVQAKRVDLEG